MRSKEYMERTEQYVLHTYNRFPAVLESGEGVWLTDVDGKKYLDFGAGIAVFALGYGNKAYEEALNRQIGKLIHTSNLYYSVPLAEASEKLVKASEMDKVFFTNSGTEAIEGAIKAARKYAYLKDGSTDHEIIAMNNSFHGMSKGSGMIHPNMCTMLSFVTTDACISQELLQKALGASVVDSYNMISVDGDTSTNDTCLLLANGQAGNPEIVAEDEDYAKFTEALDYVNTYLAKHMAADGEGATKLFEVKVIGAENKEQAVTLAKSVVTSNLTKAAIYGRDANWGRILCAMGYSGAQFDPEKVDLYFESAAGKLKIIENGVSTGYSEEEATRILSEDAVTAIADVKLGEACATAWGCDLTYDYVKINADYRS